MQRPLINLIPQPLLRSKRPLRPAVLHKLNRMNQTDMTQLSHIRMLSKLLLQAPRQPGRHPSRILQHRLRLKNMLYCKRRRTAQRIAAVRVAVHKRLSLTVIRIKRIIHLLRRNRDRHRQIPAREPLRHTHDIRRDPGLRTREHRACPPEARRDLIADEQHTIGITKTAQASQILRRIHAHACTALQQRLNNQGRRLRPMLRKALLRSCHALNSTVPAAAAVRTAIAVRRIDMDIVHHHRLVKLRKQIHAADRKSPDGLPVIPLRQTHETLPLPMSRLQLILKSHLQRTLHRSRPVIGKMELHEPRRHNLCQCLCQLNRRLMREIRKNHMLQLINLRLHRRIDGLIAMSEQIAPPRAHDIQITLAVHIIKPYTLAMINDHRRQLLIILHLCTGMPYIFQITRFY